MSEEERGAERVRLDIQIAMREQLDLNWARVHEITTRLVINNLNDRDQGAKHNIMLNDLRHDRVVSVPAVEGAIKAENAVVVLGMRRAPASKDRHHDREGGLVVHLLEMWDMWVTDGNAIVRQFGKPHQLLNDANVWRTILYHDLNKVWRYKLESQDPWKTDYAKDHDHLARLLGNRQKSFWFLHKYGIHLTLPLYNALLCSEGGYNDHRPEIETVLAKMVYLLDEMSANIFDRLNTDRFWDSKRGGISESGDTP